MCCSQNWEDELVEKEEDEDVNFMIIHEKRSYKIDEMLHI